MDRLWVIARIELHLTDDEFWHLSYRQFSLLHDRALTLRWQDQWQMGAAIAAIQNNGMRSYKTAPEAKDYVFTIVPGQKLVSRSTTKRTPEGIFDLFRRAAKDHEQYAR